MATPEWAIAGARLLASDIEHGLGADVEIVLAPPDVLGDLAESDDESTAPMLWVELRAHLDGVAAGGGGLDVEGLAASPTLVAYKLALLVHEGLLVASGRVWPAHPQRPSVPLSAGEGGWCDSESGSVVLNYGEVRLSSDRPRSPDGTVLWWLDPIDFGVIASDDGDLAFNYFTLEPDAEGRRQIPTRGQRVRYSVAERRLGAFRVAEKVSVQKLIDRIKPVTPFP